MYINRHIEKEVLKVINTFKVLLLTGPRQVGKSTLLKHLLKEGYNYVTLDDIIFLGMAKEDPKLFFENNPRPLIIDEVQYAPELFSEIKRIVDDSDEYGSIILTGSQTFSLMEGVTETLAGRVGILELSGLSFREVNNISYKNEFIPTNTFLERKIDKKLSDLWEFIFKGDLPELHKNKNIDPQIYYSSYVKTYLQRDVRTILNVTDLDSFSKFLVSVAARSASVINYTAIANEIGKDVKTVISWTKVLETSGLIVLIPPFSNNKIKRVISNPVIYFLNTGLLSYLLRWTSKETLKNGAFSGQVLETYVVSEIIKSFKNKAYIDVPLSFYRDYDGNEIDLVIEADGILYPIEVKKTMYPKKEMTKSFSLIDKAIGFKRGKGLILSLLEEKVKFSDELYAYPIKNI